MDYRDGVFLSVAEKLSFSKAAEELFISQPAVTNHIKSLEEKLNITLFERKGNGVYLTKAGELTYNRLKLIQQKYDEFEFELGQITNSFKGKLRIGASSTIGQYIIPSVIASFLKRYPDIEFFLYNGNSFEIEQKLINSTIDLALVENESAHSNIKYIDFMDDEIVAVTGSNSVYAKRKVISINDFTEIPLILREKGSGTLEVIKRSLKNYNISLDKLNIQAHLGSTESIKNFLSNFDGIALVSERAIERELKLREIAKLNIKNLNINRKFRIALRHGYEGLVPQLFIKFLHVYNI